jgi:hypothetical protein
MSSERVYLSAITFILAISGAFANTLLVHEYGAISKADRPSQKLECELVESCSNTGEFPCQINISGIVYPLKKIIAIDICVDQLTHNMVFAETTP